MHTAKSLDTRIVSNLYFHLLPIQILLAVVASLNGIISGLFGSNFIGAEAMSAIGLYNPLNLFITAVSMMIVGGTQILCGKYMGRNEPDRVRSIFSTMLILTLIISAVEVIVLVLGTLTQATRIFTTDTAILDQLNPYILGMAVGVVPLNLGNLLAAFLSLENKTFRTNTASVVLAIATLGFSALFVVILKMSTFGLALSSSMGFWAFMAVLAQYYLSGKSQLAPSVKKFRVRDALDTLIIGYPSALSQGYQMVRGLIVNALILSFVGSAGMSSFAASNSVMLIWWGFHAGMLVVYRMLMSISIGEEDRKSLVDVTKTAFIKGGALLLLLAISVSLCAVPLTRLFFRDPSEPVFQMTVMGLRILPFCMPFSLLCSHMTCYAQASGKQLMVHVLSVMDGVLWVAGYSAVLIPVIGMNGVYIANILNGVSCLLTIIAFAWIGHRSFPRNIEQMMLIPDSFGVPEDKRIDISVREMNEVVSVSGRVSGFCQSQGVDERRSYFAALFLEEMAGNVVTHGFHKDNKQHSVDIRVILKDNNVILRIKDDCIPFNPEERLKLMDPEDPTRNLGIRMVYRCAKNVDYQNMMGLNVLTITI